MSRVLLLHPSRWGRGITPPWIASHTAVLKSRGHQVELFDATFYKDWALNETEYNTANGQYQESEYSPVYSDVPVREALQAHIERFDPDVIFWSAISSMIHGEGEYAAIEHGHGLLAGVETNAFNVVSGLQATALSEETVQEGWPLINATLHGESEFSLPDLISWKLKPYQQKHPIQLSEFPLYDYSLFSDQAFLRPYNGKVVRAVDYEISRGCPYTCSYCVETVIQKYYGFTENTNGVLKNAKNYLRCKTAQQAFDEMRILHEQFKIELFRMQDTNFLSIDHETLWPLAQLITRADWPIKLYIETRLDGINENHMDLLKRLKVDGIGMGIETAADGYRREQLNRFASKDSIIKAFRLLKQAGIKRTAYNVIGFPGETEQNIQDTIQFNQELDPDNITVAFYSPFLGTPLAGDQHKANLDPQLRPAVDDETLKYYKANFVKLVRA